ncbi:uncharacterized protein EV420DRAFT_21260 [Desarmillaria tabescens]|uniref:Uncharacterized protein n=1 Tax=Armillaria tabescens TaxID=1929756 RepID=A0AA39NP99_ARMTA|nr:uncharacterized protein EV420DRAFT_21260 [Desarmillaria tabescens]KAK0469293.1 hypothetical protein EV420DRAFT_21260 [Desarmillaria tabescens]
MLISYFWVYIHLGLSCLSICLSPAATVNFQADRFYQYCAMASQLPYWLAHAHPPTFFLAMLLQFLRPRVCPYSTHSHWMIRSIKIFNKTRGVKHLAEISHICHILMRLFRIPSWPYENFNSARKKHGPPGRTDLELGRPKHFAFTLLILAKLFSSEGVLGPRMLADTRNNPTRCALVGSTNS